MKKKITKKIYILALLVLSTISYGQTRVLTVDNSNWSDSPGAWKLPDLVTDTTIPAIVANNTDTNTVANNVLLSTVDNTYYQRLVTNSASAASGDMKFTGTGTLVIDVNSDQFYTFGGSALVHQSNTTPSKLTIDCKVQLNNTFTTTTTNRNSVLRVTGDAGNILEFSSLSEIIASGNGPTVTWPGAGTIQLNGKITGTRGLVTGIGTTIFGSTFDPSGFNVAANTITVSGNSNAIVNTATNGNFYKNTLGRITMSGSNGQSSTLTLNNANVWNSPLLVTTLSIDRVTGANLILKANQTVNTGTLTLTNGASGASVLNLTVDPGVSVNFANSSAITWTAGSVLNIYGFDGATSIKFGTTSGGLSTTQLSQICLKDGVNAGKAVILDATGKLTVDPVTTTWLGTTSVYNLATNWSTGAVPTLNSNVVIPVTANNPVMASNGNMYSLTVASGATLTVGVGFVLNVSGKIDNSGTINIFNNAHLIQRFTVQNSGTFNVYRRSSTLNRLDFTMWSSPVSGAQTLAQFSPLTSSNRFYNYDSATDQYVATSSTGTFTPGTGYLIRMPNENPAELGMGSAYYAGSAAIAYTGIFTGVANNGNYTLTGLTSDKFYAVGNPYPSALSATTFLANNATGGTLYFWRKTNAIANLTSSYATRNSTGGTAAGIVAPNDNIPTAVIQAGQGFIVKTGVTATSLTFSNGMRSNSVVNQYFFKTKQEAEPDRVWLNLTSAAGAFSQTLVGYFNGATLGVDNGFDGEYINDCPIALTSNINNEEYTIQCRPAFDATDVVALNFKTNVAGDYNIALDHFDGLFATGQDVYLVDSKTGAETNLKSGSYTFNAAVGTDNARFTLKYQKTLKVDAPALDDNSITVYKNNGTLYVNSKSVAISNIKIFDIQGRLLTEQKNVKSNTAIISNLRADNQVLIVKIAGEDNSEVTKKLLN